MEQTKIVDPRAPEGTPRGPIIVFGKQNDYLLVGRTVEQVIEETHPPVDGNGREGMGKATSRRLRIDELDFFDSAGRSLEPVMAAGRLKGFVVKDLRKEICERIEEMFRMIEPEIRKENLNPDEVPLGRLLCEDLSPEEFINKLAEENVEAKGPGGLDCAQQATSDFVSGCSFWDRICGRC